MSDNNIVISLDETDIVISKQVDEDIIYIKQNGETICIPNSAFERVLYMMVQFSESKDAFEATNPPYDHSSCLVIKLTCNPKEHVPE